MFEKQIGTMGFSFTGISMADGQVDNLLDLMEKYELPFYWEEWNKVFWLLAFMLDLASFEHF